MTKYYKTHYGYRSYDEEGLLTIIAVGVILAGLVVWLCAKLFIPVIVVDVVYLLYCWRKKLRANTKIAIILGVVTIVTGFCFFAR